MQSNKKPASKRISARKLVWRSGRDSNPRGIAPKLISSLLVSVSTSGRFVSVSGRLVCAESRIK